MPRKKSESLFPDYVRIRYADMDVLGALTQRAIGPNRSLTEFAEVCGLSPSTISRVVNGKFTKYISDGVIAAIAKNADPDSGVTLKDLLAANGMLPMSMVTSGKATVLDESIPYKKPKADPEPPGFCLTKRSGSTVYFDTSKIAQAIEKAFKATDYQIFPETSRAILQSVLLDQGYSIEVMKEYDIVSLPQFRYLTPFTFRTNAAKEDGLELWAFDVHDGNRYSLYQKLSWIFGTAYLDSPAENGLKVSLVTDNQEEFYEAKEKFGSIVIKDCISVILIDTTLRTVIEEFQLKREGVSSHPSIFEKGVG